MRTIKNIFKSNEAANVSLSLTREPRVLTLLQRVFLKQPIRVVLKLFHYRSYGLDAIVLTEAEIKQLRAENEGEWDLVLEILEEGRTIYECNQQEKCSL